MKKTSRLKVFRSGLAKLVVGAALAVSLGGKIIADDYYVSTTGDDSRTEQQAQNISTPWKTIQHAIDSIEGGEENPHAIHVMPGTYIENIVMDNYESLQGAGADKTILRSVNGENIISGADNVKIDGFTIQGPGIGVRSYYPSIRISNNIITGCGAGIGFGNYPYLLCKP